tara:strand:+ start:56 stop:721 length:666 start_codon:yes stop_codon:yes gene_type:complete
VHQDLAAVKNEILLEMNSALLKTISDLKSINIPEERKKTLQPLVDFIQHKYINNQPIRLNFICTHNSRRSHLSQIWSQALAYHFGLQNIVCYSGGTEATAVYSSVIKTLKQQGFNEHKLSDGSNAIYAMKYAVNEPGIIAFSKTFDHSFNPNTEFAAIMTCSQADAGCPFIAGAEKRIPITFEDPKAFDDTPLELEKYQERSLQIASELHHVFSKISSNED